MSDNVDERYFDYRVVEHYIAQGVVTREQYEAFLASVDDATEMGEDTETRMEHSGQE
jgi:hypothetical protein